MVEVMGIAFAPLNVPLKRRLQTLAALGHAVCPNVMSVFCCCLTLYVICFTRFYWLAIAYFCYIVGERDAPKTGSRRSQWVRRWAWWRYFRDYFPVKLVKTAELDTSKNYLLCCFPHGMLASGAFANFATDGTAVSEVFPGISHYIITFIYPLLVPGMRELTLRLGFCSSSRETLDNLLNPVNGTGRSVAILVGGIKEYSFSQPGVQHIILKKRKGFIKVALQNGASLVPVYTFGENELYGRVNTGVCFGLFSLLPKAAKDWMGMTIGLVNGRGLFQYSFGFIAQRKPLTTVVGKPMEVEQVREPTQQQIDDLHRRFTEELVALFEEHKHRYLEDPENVSLIIG